MKQKRGFTLLELMVVISIIILLASTLVTAGMYAHKLTMENVTVNTIKMVELAVENYASDYGGEYPFSHQTVTGDDDAIVGSGKCGIQALCTYIFKNPALDSVLHLGKDDSYAFTKDFKNDCVAKNADGTANFIRDAWGTPLFYFRPGAPTRNSDSFDLFSAGPDQKTPCEAYDKTNTSIHNYLSVAPMEFDGTNLVAAAGATGAPTEIGGAVIDPVDSNIKYVWDDIGNWGYIKDSGN